MTNQVNNQINLIPTQQGGVTGSPFAQFKTFNSGGIMNPINNINSNQPLQQNAGQKVGVTQNILPQDTFDKKEKTKKIVKYSAIGVGIAAVAYSAFALIKHRDIEGFLPKLAEPIKVLIARINPNKFTPSVSIEENEIKYLSQLFEHICRLSKKQQDKFVINLYSKTTQKGKDALSRHFSDVINR